jgi:hypothetical protein
MMTRSLVFLGTGHLVFLNKTKQKYKKEKKKSIHKYKLIHQINKLIQEMKS